MTSRYLPKGYSVFSFDFSGSGLSDGEYVSLGYYEAMDLDTVVSYLDMSEDVKSVVLWGRSMGAVSALAYAKNDPSISCLILDSAFCKLTNI